MQFRKILCAVLFLFVLVTVAQAEPITLNVTSWSFSSLGGDSDRTIWQIQAVDSTGKAVTIQFRINTQLFGGGTLTVNTSAAVSGLPYTATTNSIFASFGYPGDPFPRNGQATYSLSGDFPRNGSNAPSVTALLGFSGSLAINGQSLSFAFAPSTGTIGYYNLGGGLYGGVSSISASGTGGTVTIDQATPIPEPATLFLLGSGLAALGLKARRRKQ